MQGLQHPLSGDRYELEADGTITVHPAGGGATGVFDGAGRWLSGTVTWADPALCVWLAGGSARSSRAPSPTPSPPAAAPGAGADR